MIMTSRVVRHICHRLARHAYQTSVMPSLCSGQRAAGTCGGTTLCRRDSTRHLEAYGQPPARMQHGARPGPASCSIRCDPATARAEGRRETPPRAREACSSAFRQLSAARLVLVNVSTPTVSRTRAGTGSRPRRRSGPKTMEADGADLTSCRATAVPPVRRIRLTLGPPGKIERLHQTLHWNCSTSTARSRASRTRRPRWTPGARTTTTGGRTSP
jgi:hypothetical protein